MIACKHYDVIELVCTLKLPVELHLKNAERVQGVAVDTRIENKIEHIVLLALDGQSEKTFVVLDDIAKLCALIENPHIDSVDFQ